jgi:membrane protein YdbS with pleckstrin-like domain
MPLTQYETGTAMSDSAPYSLEETLLHKTLVSTNRLQELSAASLVLLMVLNALVVGWAWLHLSVSSGIAASVLLLAASLTNWALLWLLPRTGRSFGPDKPSALALILLLTVVMALIGTFASSSWALFSAAAAAIAITLVVFYATWIEPFRLGVTKQTLTIKGGASSEGGSLRLLHVGDLHLERETARERQ